MSARRLRVGLFGLLGSGNIGNDASVEAIMRYLRAEYPGRHHRRHVHGLGPDARPVRHRDHAFQWQQVHDRPGLSGKALAAFGKVIDTFRTAGWVRGHDVVIIPGMGILDPTLRLHPWGMPYAVYLLAAWGRLFGAKVALVAVGADKANAKTTQWLYNRTAKLVAYLSFRDESSRQALQGEGVDVSGFSVHPDLVWTIPVTRAEPKDPKLVAVGVMAYYGGQADRGRALRSTLPTQSQWRSSPGGFSTAATMSGSSTATKWTGPHWIRSSPTSGRACRDSLRNASPRTTRQRTRT